MLAAIAAMGSLITAFLVYRMQQGQGRGETLIKIVERLESRQSRDRKNQVYRLHAQREAYVDWPADAQQDVDAWAAELDAIALLVKANQVDRGALLHIYGDVALRSVFIIAAYANEQRAIRGRQFLLPLSDLTAELVAVWQDQAARGAYPSEIGMRDGSIHFTPRSFVSDPHVATFLAGPASPSQAPQVGADRSARGATPPAPEAS